MRFCVYDHRDRVCLLECEGFDEAMSMAKLIHMADPARLLEIQRLDWRHDQDDDHLTWVPTGWTYGALGTCQ